MICRNQSKKHLIIFGILTTFISLILTIFTFVSYTYLTGFLIGSLISLIGYLFNYFALEKWLRKKRSKKISFWMTMIKSFVWMMVVAGLFIGILFANKSLNSNSSNFWSWIDGVFNILFVIFGLSMMLISIFCFSIWETVQNKRSRKEQQNG